MLTRIIALARRISPGMNQTLVRLWYHYLAVADKEAHLLFMNYGYADLQPGAEALALSEVDERNRYCIQLYHHVAGALDLQGLDVLEVGCGRGGGASYIMRSLQPHSLIGIDSSAKAIAFCNRHYSMPGLSFLHGNAEALPFAESTFDVIVNVESSHCYRSMESFLHEAFRVLRPNGYFLFADFRHEEHIEALRQQFLQCGFALLNEERITLNVLEALQRDNTRKLALIHQKVPRILEKQVQEFAATRGTKAYEAFRTGERDYRSFLLQKPGREHVR